MKKTLVLNSAYEPIGTISWTRALVLDILKKVIVVKYYEDFEARSISRIFKCPAIISIKDYINVSNKYLRYSKTNIFERDNYICQYCGKQKKWDELTIDHVVPRSMGGDSKFENVVTACKGCNQWKGNNTPEDAGMRLLKQPTKPLWQNVALKTKNAPKEWEEFLCIK